MVLDCRMPPEPSDKCVLADDVHDPGDAEPILQHPVYRCPLDRCRGLDDGRVVGRPFPVGGDLLGRLAATRRRTRSRSGVTASPQARRRPSRRVRCRGRLAPHHLVGRLGILDLPGVLILLQLFRRSVRRLCRRGRRRADTASLRNVSVSSSGRAGCDWSDQGLMHGDRCSCGRGAGVARVSGRGRTPMSTTRIRCRRAPTPAMLDGRLTAAGARHAPCRT